MFLFCNINRSCVCVYVLIYTICSEGIGYALQVNFCAFNLITLAEALLKDILSIPRETNYQNIILLQQQIGYLICLTNIILILFAVLKYLMIYAELKVHSRSPTRTTRPWGPVGEGTQFRKGVGIWFERERRQIKGCVNTIYIKCGCLCVRALVQWCVCVRAGVCVIVQPVWVKIKIYILMVLGIAQLLVDFCGI